MWSRIPRPTLLLGLPGNPTFFPLPASLRLPAVGYALLEEALKEFTTEIWRYNNRNSLEVQMERQVAEGDGANAGVPGGF